MSANYRTPEAARAQQCPRRFALPDPQCLADGCALWLWAQGEDDGFEHHEERGLYWRETLADEDDPLRAFFMLHLGEEGAALAARWVETPLDDYDAQEELAAEIDERLAKAWTEGEESALDRFAMDKRPGDDWGLKDAFCEEGQMVAIYQRPARKRGFCGALAQRSLF